MSWFSYKRGGGDGSLGATVNFTEEQCDMHPSFVLWGSNQVIYSCLVIQVKLHWCHDLAFKSVTCESVKFWLKFFFTNCCKLGFGKEWKRMVKGLFFILVWLCLCTSFRYKVADYKYFSCKSLIYFPIKLMEYEWNKGWKNCFVWVPSSQEIKEISQIFVFWCCQSFKKKKCVQFSLSCFIKWSVYL